MLVSIAMAALSYLGVKGNMGKAAALADSMPTMMPAFAVAGGGQMGSAGAGTAVATGVPGPAGPVGTAMAMTADKEGESGGSDKDPVPEVVDKQSTAEATAENATGKGSQAAAKGVVEEAKLGAPAARHRAARVKMKTMVKKDNTVIEPGIDVAGDVAAIRSGKATRVKGNYVINGRTYGAHDGTLFPISGPGFHYLTRSQFRAFGVYNEFGNTPRAIEILDKMGIPAADRAGALRVFEAIK